MRWMCKKRNNGPMPHPAKKMLFGCMMLGYFAGALWLTFRLTNALEVMAAVQALGEMGDALTGEERAALEGRIRGGLL